MAPCLVSLAGTEPIHPLRRPGLHASTTRGATARIRETAIRRGGSAGRDRAALGPEQVFRVRLRRPAMNFGVAVVWRAQGVQVEPRIVRAGDEDRLIGQTALPINLNPYLRQYRQPTPAAGAVRPTTGSYDVVFDGPSLGRRGRFRFRYWVNDTTRPGLRVPSRTVPQGAPLRVRATDRARASIRARSS